MKHMRLLVSLDCNFKCAYCCNQLPSIRAKIEPIDIEDLLCKLPKYASLNLTGGEPLLPTNLSKTLMLARVANIIQKPVYLYTNFSLIDPSNEDQRALFDLVQGVNIGIHPSNNAIRPCTEIIDEALQYFKSDITKIRLHVQRNDASRLFPGRGIPLKLWDMNDCSPRLPEDLFLFSPEEG